MTSRPLRLPAGIVLGIALVLPGGRALADEKPRLELGVGVAPVSFPAYRGSAEQVNLVLPIPYVAYRSERLRVDREGARGMLLESPRFEIDVSIDGAIPVDSDNDGPRAGMDDLAPLFELGPSLNWMLTEDRRWQLRLPVRAAISVDSASTRHRGWTAHPVLRYSTPAPVAGWDLGFNIGPLFASRAFHGYYYDVDESDAIPGEREPFRSAGGYSGAAVLASASRRFDGFWLGAFLRYDDLTGARFEDSPLVETRQAVTAGLGISWVLWESDETVPARHAPLRP